MASIFSDIEQAPSIEVFALIAEYNNDKHPDKVNLSVGGKAYCLVLYLPKDKFTIRTLADSVHENTVCLLSLTLWIPC